MSHYIKELSAKDKEDLKNTLDSPGMKVLEHWLLGKIAIAPRLALEKSLDYEGVMYHKGILHGYVEVNDFIDVARDKLRNMESEG